MHHKFMHAHIQDPKFMVMAETSNFGIFSGRNVHGRNALGRNVRGRNVQAPAKTTHLRQTLFKWTQYRQGRG